MDSTHARLEVLTRQMTGASDSPLAIALCHDNFELRAEMLDFLRAPLYKPNFYQSLMEFRSQTLQRLQAFAEQGFFKTEDYLKSAMVFGHAAW
jgi:hypothetical protein